MGRPRKFPKNLSKSERAEKIAYERGLRRQKKLTKLRMEVAAIRRSVARKEEKEASGGKKAWGRPRKHGRSRSFTVPAADAEKFWASVEGRGPDECWRWTGKRKPTVRDSFMMPWKVGWALEGLGPLPDGARAIPEKNRCGNEWCCSPYHVGLTDAVKYLLRIEKTARIKQTRRRYRERFCARTAEKLTVSDLLRMRKLLETCTIDYVCLKFKLTRTWVKILTGANVRGKLKWKSELEAGRQVAEWWWKTYSEGESS